MSEGIVRGKVVWWERAGKEGGDCQWMVAGGRWQVAGDVT